MKDQAPLPYSPPPGGYKKPPPGTGRSARLRKELFNKLVALHGFCPCFVCALPVEMADATLEHIVPLARGGRRGKRNMSISHRICNHRRGAPPPPWLPEPLK